MHVQAKGAAVDLRYPQLEQVQQFFLYTAVIEIVFQAQHGLVAFG
jgi:hypothetical protein